MSMQLKYSPSSSEQILSSSLSPFIQLVQRKAVPFENQMDLKTKSISSGLLFLRELILRRQQYGILRIKQQSNEEKKKKQHLIAQEMARLPYVLDNLSLKKSMTILQRMCNGTLNKIQASKNIKNLLFLTKKVAFLKIQKYIEKPQTRAAYLIKKEQEYAAILLIGVMEHRVQKIKRDVMSSVFEKSVEKNTLNSSHPHHHQYINSNILKTTIIRDEATRNLVSSLTEVVKRVQHSIFYKMRKNPKRNHIQNQQQNKIRIKVAAVAKLFKILKINIFSIPWKKIKLCQIQKEIKQLSLVSTICTDWHTQIDMSIIKSQALVNKELESKLKRAKAKREGQKFLVKVEKLNNLLCKIMRHKLSACFKMIQKTAIEAEAQDYKNQIKTMQKEKECLMDKIDEMDTESAVDLSNSGSIPLPFNPVIVLSEQAYTEYQNFIISNIKKLLNELKEEVAHLKFDEQELKRITEEIEKQLGIEKQVNYSYLNNPQQGFASLNSISSPNFDYASHHLLSQLSLQGNTVLNL